MKGEYKGFKIDYVRSSRKCFVVQDIKGNYETLDGAEQGIDRHLKKNRKIERLEIVKNLGWQTDHRFIDAEITSITESGDVWTMDEKGKREMVTKHSFMCDRTGANQELIMTHIKMKADGRKMIDDADKLLHTADRTKIDALIEKMTTTGDQ